MHAPSLEALLGAINLRLPVFVGMRNWKPYLHETLAAMSQRALRGTLAVILSAFRTEASWERYVEDVTVARARTPAAPEVVFAPAFFDHPLFVQAVADRVRAALGRVPAADCAATDVIFTAHSVPRAMADASPYVSDFATASRLVAERLEHERWSLAYQSRSGDPRDPWPAPGVHHVRRRPG